LRLEKEKRGSEVSLRMDWGVIGWEKIRLRDNVDGRGSLNRATYVFRWRNRGGDKRVGTTAETIEDDSRKRYNEWGDEIK
jgi:hypothetical protein